MGRVLDHKLVRNTLLLTVFAFVSRGVGLLFQSLVSRSLGAAGLGEFQLLLSIHGLAATLAVSGVRFAVTRLAAEALGRGKQTELRSVLLPGFGYALFFSLLALGLVWPLAPFLARTWAGGEEGALPLRLLALGLPFLALSAVMGGFFTAAGKVGRAALLQLLEQLALVAFTLLLLPEAAGPGAGELALSFASAAASCLGFLVTLPVFLALLRGFGKQKRRAGGLRRLLEIALPLALSSYARTALGTLRHVLIPGGLRRAGASAEEALAVYGTVHGMVFPVLLFPSALLTSLAELLVPELTELQVRGRTRELEAGTARILGLCYRFAVGCAALLGCFGTELGALLYDSAQAGQFIRLLSPLVVVMYMDTVTDGMLKGLGQQLHSMAINVADAALSLALVVWLLPLWAVRGYLFILFFSECFNFALSLRRLGKLVRLRAGAAELLLPPLLALGAASASRLLGRLLPGMAGLFLALAAAGCCYAALLWLAEEGRARPAWRMNSQS